MGDVGRRNVFSNAREVFAYIGVGAYTVWLEIVWFYSYTEKAVGKKLQMGDGYG